MSGENRRIRSVLRLLLSGEVRAEAAADARSLLLASEGRGTMAVPASLLKAMAADELICRDGDRLRIAPPGRCWLQRDGQGEEGFARQHGDWMQMPRQEGAPAAQINLAESPLATVARLRDKNGRAYLTPAELRAGERLRADFTYGQLSPRLAVNWLAAGISGSGGGAAELADSVIAARQRVNRALTAAGPELAGVLIDICCFLKGLAQMESERGWPVRSAKLMLKTALASLARHYEPEPAGPQRESVRHWGGEGYRPSRFTGAGS